VKKQNKPTATPTYAKFQVDGRDVQPAPDNRPGFKMIIGSQSQLTAALTEGSLAMAHINFGSNVLYVGPSAIGALINALINVRRDLLTKRYGPTTPPETQVDTRTYPYYAVGQRQPPAQSWLTANLSATPGEMPMVHIKDMPDSVEFMVGISAERCANIGGALIAMANDAATLQAQAPLEYRASSYEYSIVPTPPAAEDEDEE
jgi:hypothetical protein